MTEPFDDRFEERLREALHSEADRVHTSHDALERIKARTERKRFLWSGWSWMRPAVAVGAAALIAGSVLLGTPQIREHMLPGSFVSATDSHKAPPESSPSAQDSANPSGRSAKHPGENVLIPAVPPSFTLPPPADAPADLNDPDEDDTATPACGTPKPTSEARSSTTPDTKACAPTDSPKDSDAHPLDPDGDHPGDAPPDAPAPDAEDPSELPDDAQKTVPSP